MKRYFAGNTARLGIDDIDDDELDVLVNDGVIRPLYGTMTIHPLPSASPIDLDGVSEAGVVDVDDGSFLATEVSLNIYRSLTDPFDGTILIGEGDRLYFRADWILGEDDPSGGGLIEMNGGDGIATLQSNNTSILGTNARLRVTSGKAILQTPLTVLKGEVSVAAGAAIQFNEATYFAAAANFVGGNLYDLFVQDTLVFLQSEIDWDSPGPGSHTTSIGPSGSLTFDGNSINPVDITFRGTIEMNGGSLTVNTTGPWTLDRNMYLHTQSSDEQTPQVAGAAGLVLGDNFTTGTDGLVVVDGNGTAEIQSPLTVRRDGEVQIGAGAELILHGNSEIQRNAEVTGPGPLVNQATMTLADGSEIDTVLRNSGLLKVGGNQQIGVSTVEEFLQQSQSARLQLEIVSPAPGDYDQLIVNGSAELSGTLEVVWIGPKMPSRGEQFTLIQASEFIGTFQKFALPAVVAEDTWELRYEEDTLVLEVVSALTTADFDEDGDVDGADFLLIQRDDPSLISLWEQQYGATTNPINAVPEPGGVVPTLVVMGCYIFCIRREGRES